MLLESVFQALYMAYRVALALYQGLDLFWSVVFSAVSYTLGVVIRVTLIVVIERATFHGVCSLLMRRMLFGAFFGFVSGQTLAVIIAFNLLQTLLTFEFAHILGSDKVGGSHHEEGRYMPLGGGRPVDASDHRSF